MFKCKCHTELKKARAELARLKELPVSDFTVTGYIGVNVYGVDGKANAIARAKAKIAGLEVLTDNNCPTTQLKVY